VTTKTADTARSVRRWGWSILLTTASISLAFNIGHALNPPAPTHAPGEAGGAEVHAVPVALAVLYGVAPVLVALMLSHLMAIQAGRAWKRAGTGLVFVAALALSVRAIYEVLEPIAGRWGLLFALMLDVASLLALQEVLSAPRDAAKGDADRDTRHDADRDMARDTATATRVTVGDIPRDTNRDTDAIVSRDIRRDIEAGPTRRRRTATKRTARSASRDTAQMSAEDRMARAREVLAEAPDISGAELGRRLGLSPRQGQRLLADVRSADADPIPGQLAMDDAHDATADRDTRDTRDADTDDAADTGGADVVRLSVVGGDR